MNIFVTSKCPKESAVALDDKRVVKMTLESAQMLSTALHIHPSPVVAPYKINHKNHPCTIWARTTRKNYEWLLEHFVALCNEYSYRYNRVHGCARLIPTFYAAIDSIPYGDLTEFANCTIYKENTNVIQAYRDFMIHKWNNLDKIVPRWSYRSKPIWA